MGCRCQRLWEKIILIAKSTKSIHAQRWEDLKNIGVHGTKISPENLIYFGVRDTETEESQIKKLDIRNYKVDEVRFRGLQTCVKEALNKLSNCDLIYISFDVDSMDCDMISYGTGTPVPKGFDQHGDCHYQPNY
jgi:arginase